MKKKLVFALVLAVLVAGGAFADHPDGFGVGVVGSYGFGGPGFGGIDVPAYTVGRIKTVAGLGYGLSLKIPGVPVFWTVKLGFTNYSFKAGIGGDFYFIDDTLLPDLGIGWHFGVGGFFDFISYDDKFLFIADKFTYLDFGVRIPVGVSYMVMPEVEVFLDLVPSLGLGIANVEKSWGVVYNKTAMEFFWDVPIELGVRYWF